MAQPPAGLGIGLAAKVTSALVVAEGQDWFLRRYDQRRALQFLNFVRELTPLVVEAFGSEELEECAGLLKKFSNQSLTLADAHGLYIMANQRVRTCWSTDRRLPLTGVPLVV